MPVIQTPQPVSPFELLVEPISPVPIPSTVAASSAPTPTAAAVPTLHMSPGPLGRILRTMPAAGVTTVVPIAIQGYFLWITNLATAPLIPFVTVSADPIAITLLTTVTNPPDPTTASVLAITSIGDPSLGFSGNIFGYLQPAGTGAALTLPAAIPPGGTALFTLVGNYGLFPNLSAANLEARGSLSIGIDPSSPAQFAPVLLAPQTRTVYVTPNVPAPSETAFALPTALGRGRYALPAPVYYITSLVNGLVLDASGPIVSSGGSLNRQAVIAPVNGSPTQLWHITADGYIVSAANEYVLDLQAGVTSNGTPVIVYPRNNPPTSNQQWTITASGAIESQLGGVVLDVPDGNPSKALQIYAPNSGFNQQWVLVPAQP